MNPELLAAYHYLSSAIAQAFAALIGLTAVFYIYRRGILKQQMKEVLNYLILFTVDPFIDNYPEKYKKNIEIALLYFLEFNKLNRPEKTLSVIKNRLGKFKDPQKESRCKTSLSEYLNLQSIYKKMANKIVIPLLFSTATMIIAISALLLGWYVYAIAIELTVGIMIFESALAALALIWTVIVIIKMLKEPQPEAEV